MKRLPIKTIKYVSLSPSPFFKQENQPKYEVPGKFLMSFQTGFSQGQLAYYIVPSAWPSLVLIIIPRN